MPSCCSRLGQRLRLSLRRIARFFHEGTGEEFRHILGLKNSVLAEFQSPSSQSCSDKIEGQRACHITTGNLWFRTLMRASWKNAYQDRSYFHIWTWCSKKWPFVPRKQSLWWGCLQRIVTPQISPTSGCLQEHLEVRKPSLRPRIPLLFIISGQGVLGRRDTLWVRKAVGATKRATILLQKATF